MKNITLVKVTEENAKSIAKEWASDEYTSKDVYDCIRAGDDDLIKKSTRNGFAIGALVVGSAVAIYKGVKYICKKIRDKKKKKDNI